jgi:MSHA biogenesis protein MshQ
VPFRAESYDGTRFAAHADDACTEIAASAISLAPAPPALATAASVAHEPFAAGLAGLSLSAPGAGNTGAVDLGVDLTALGLPWLQFDWDGDGSYAEDPSGRATFGIYRGSDARIDLRERY